MRGILSVVLVFTLGACSSRSYDTTLVIREGGDPSLFASVASLSMQAARDGHTLTQNTFSASTSQVSLSNLPFGQDTIVSLQGLSSSGDIVASGSTCNFDFEAGTDTTASLYFAPTQYFALTAGSPPASRTGQMVTTLPSGDVLLFGGTQDGTAVNATMRYSESTGTFADAPSLALSTPRTNGEVSGLGIGALLTGGLDATGAPLGTAELLVTGTMQLSPIINESLGARAELRTIVIDSDRVILTGGVDATGKSLDTTAVVIVQSDGTVQVTAGPPLVNARAAHAGLVAIRSPVVVGGYGATGAPITSIEALELADDGDIGTFREISNLMYARADATATLLGDGSILVAGGIGSNGQPRADAEVYNPITQDTRLYTMAAPRSGHTATLLADGRVLVVGGNGAPLDAELFIVDVGFVSEHPPNEPRVGHVAVPLCDGTVLIEGSSPDAELYTPSAS